MKRFIYLSVVCTFLIIDSFKAQNTVGLINYNNPTAGYTLFTPETSNFVYLVDDCGYFVNKWTFSDAPRLTCYLLEDGTMVRANTNSIEARDWNNNLLWSADLNTLGYVQHHDIAVMPNGHVLLLVFDIRTSLQSKANGRNPANAIGALKLDAVVEIEITGINQAFEVWRWSFWDHLVQDFDSSKLNFGDVANSPQLLDINYDLGEMNDYTHCNAIDYNPALNQIMLSARHLSEIYIIEHTSSTQDATGHTGGIYGKGGDFLYRWGNPDVYQQGNPSDQKLFLQHDSKWVKAGYPDAGKISAFSNGPKFGDSISSIVLFQPEIVANDYIMNNGAFEPQNLDFSWSGVIYGDTMFESRKSGAHFLSNGNFMFTENSKGRITEMDKSGIILWTYVNPQGLNLYNQYDILQQYSTAIFRGEKYESNYLGLIGKDLSPKGLIEDQNTLSVTCNSSLGIDVQNLNKIFVANPVTDQILAFIEPLEFVNLTIMSVTGKTCYYIKDFSGKELSVQLDSGIYFVTYEKEGKVYSQKIIVDN